VFKNKVLSRKLGHEKQKVNQRQNYTMRNFINCTVVEDIGDMRNV
jgi:hypothetical protein